MDVKSKYVIVMSNDGGFYRAKKEEAYGVGKEISFSPLPERSNFFSLSNWKVKISSIAATCTVLGGILFALIPRAVPVYAYVSVDINPSVEFSVGNNWDVIKTTFTNKDGEELLSTLPNFHGKPIDAAIDQIISAAKKEGKLQDKGYVWITSVLANQDHPEALAKNELQQLQTELETKEKVQIQVGTTTEKIRDDAEHLGISPGKYVYYQNAKKLGVPISVQNVENDSVTKLVSVLQEKRKTGSNGNVSDTSNTDSTSHTNTSHTSDTSNISATTSPSRQKVSKAAEENKKTSKESSSAVSEDKKQILNTTPVVKNTETPNNNQSSEQKQNENNKQKQNNNENRHEK